MGVVRPDDQSGLGQKERGRGRDTTACGCVVVLRPSSNHEYLWVAMLPVGWIGGVHSLECSLSL